MSTLSLSGFLRRSPYWFRIVAVRWQLLSAIAVLWLAAEWLKDEYASDDSNLWLVMRQFISVAQWVVVTLFSFSLLTALISWALFLFNNNRKKIKAEARLGVDNQAEAGWVPVTVSLRGLVLRPLLGTIQASLVFHDSSVSDPVILDGAIPKARSIFRQGIQGNALTLLHDRGIYDVEKIMLSFTDMLGLISLPALMPFTRQLYTLPVSSASKKMTAEPNAVEEQKHRIQIPRRVEGEYVNYKEFESGDNIRRIVWKIYAKSGELVVRIPEIKDPYASHLYFYASFFNGLSKDEGAFERELLNVYKDGLRNLFEGLQKNGYDVRMPHDQEVPKLPTQKLDALFQITSARWHRDMTLQQFVNPAKAAVVCVSSLVPASEVSAVLQNLHSSIPVVVMKMSSAISSPFRFSLRDVFFRPEPMPSDRLRQPWLISGLRRDLLKNEEALNELLTKRENSWMSNSFKIEQ